jgi:hypothetical protein
VAYKKKEVREAMKEKEGKGKGIISSTAIFGVIIAVLLVAAILVILLSTSGAYSNGGPYNLIDKQAPIQKALRGQDLQFDTGDAWTVTPVTVYRVVEGSVENTYTADANNRIFDVNWPLTGAYYVNYVNLTTFDAQIAVEDPSIPISLKVGTKTVSAIAVGTTVKVDAGGINLFPEDIVDLKVIGPDGQIKTDTINNQVFTNISVATLTSTYGTTGIDTNGWKIGTYTFQIRTKAANACGLDMSSELKTLVIRKADLSIEAEKTTCVELEVIRIMVTGAAYDQIEVRADPMSPDVQFLAGVEDTPGAWAWCGPDPNCFYHAIDEDGMRTYAVKFEDTGRYSIRVTVTGGSRAGEYDTVDIMVTGKAVTFSVPSTLLVGESVTVAGSANAGERVDVAIDGFVYSETNDLVLDEFGNFSVSGIGPFMDPGPVKLTAYINRAIGAGPVGAVENEDGSATLYILTAADGGIDISASRLNVGRNESLILTIGAQPQHNVSVTTVDQAHTVFEYNRYDFTGTSDNIITRAPAATISIPVDIGDCGSQAEAMNIHGVWKVMNGDGLRKFEVYFTDIGVYTITATDYGTDYPTAARLDNETIELVVSEKNVTFDVPPIVVIGERFTIKGAAATGDTVDIAVDGFVYPLLNDLVIDAEGEFEEDIDTATACIDPFLLLGHVRLTAYIDRSAGAGYIGSSEIDDGSAAIFMVGPWLTAGVSPSSVEWGEDFTISGTARGSKSLNILVVSPRGSGGDYIDGAGWGIYSVAAAVSEADSTFVKKINVGDDVDGGVYLIVVLSPGGDGVYNGLAGWVGVPNFMGELEKQYSLAGKTQEQVREIIEAATIDAAGSDDMMRILTIQVGPPETLTLDPLADLALGEPLIVTGTSSRLDGALVWLTVKGRYYERVPQVAIVEDHLFTTTFDTTGAYPGTYTVKVIDGYGYAATRSVNIVAETVAPASFDTGHSEDPYPSISGTHNGTITIERMYTYPCSGTGGHSEYAALYDQTGTKLGEGAWKGYQGGDAQYITFSPPLTLELGKLYNYTIKTGSYPQIIHRQTLTTENGTITCAEFIDANGVFHQDWIPAIRLE